MPPQDQPFYAATTADWRSWLEAHHATENEVWLVLFRKHATTPSVDYEEATQEALCFGWIDSHMRKIDDERRILRFSPRRKGSNWSESNRQRVARLIEEGRMTDAGMAKIEEAKATGMWDRSSG